ncbi:MAG TPA: hypothetical protein VMJ64_02180 [Anaerolineales bacterium]|nr:hypothetical protein [Anaerolineales bacterium]
MSEPDKKFMGTYFDRDTVMRMARWLAILSWVVAAIYLWDVVLSLGIWGLQYARHLIMPMGFTDVAQQLLFIIERPLHGVLYFAAMQAVSKGLLMMLDIEDNTRRAARKQ